MEEKRRYVELIFFDVDGTLVDSRTDIANAVNHMLTGLGLQGKSPDTIASYIGQGADLLIRRSLGSAHEDLFDRAFALFKSFYREHCADTTKLYPGVKDALEHFREKKKIIITNRTNESASRTLDVLGIGGHFEAIVGSDDAGCMKPSACPLDRVLAKYGVDKERGIMVGDMDVDVIAGKEAGVLTCAVTYGIGRKEDIEKARPHYMIDRIADLKKVVR